jgi:hypothetical protein
MKNWILTCIFLILCCSDAVLTSIALSSGAIELNPLVNAWGLEAKLLVDFIGIGVCLYINRFLRALTVFMLLVNLWGMSQLILGGLL